MGRINERLNREIRRRTDSVGIFPNRDAMVSLVGPEQTDEWAEGRRHLGLDTLARSRLTIVTTSDPDIDKLAPQHRRASSKSTGDCMLVWVRLNDCKKRHVVADVAILRGLPVAVGT